MALWAANFLRRDSFLRMCADFLMVNIALAMAMLLRYAWLVGVEMPNQPAGIYFSRYVQSLWQSSLLLSPICLITFYLTGFYNRGLFYRSRYKALSIFQAVSISYILFGGLTFFFRVLLSPEGDFLVPRSSFLLAWAFTLAILLGSRLWSQFWTHVVEVERNATPAKPQKVTNVLLIGGAGYIGSALLQKLLDRGYRVRLLDLLLFGKEPIQDLESHPNLEIVQADFRQVDRVVEAMRGMHAVIHLGAIVGDPACAFDEKLTVEVNLMATK
ncbi:MAG: NAD-dependent epimerase/dehydratase family protein [Myxococcota bacterium]